MFEIFEVYNQDNERVFFTFNKQSVPSKKEIEILMNDGHKIKVNGKILYKKNIDEFLNKVKDKED